MTYTEDEDQCPRCGGWTDPYWHCSLGYCPDCCEDTDEDRTDNHDHDT